MAGVENVNVRLLANENVRFIRDEAAAVAAVDSETAAEALIKIHVEYDSLSAVLDQKRP